MPFLAIALTAVVAFAQVQPAAPVRVYIFAEPRPGGFVDTQMQWRRTAVEHAIARARKNKAVELVPDRALADITVEVVDVLEKEPKPQSLAWQEYQVVAELKVRDYATKLMAQDRSLNTAGRLVGDELNRWLKANREKIR